jgi:hypothetical protein
MHERSGEPTSNRKTFILVRTVLPLRGPRAARGVWVMTEYGLPQVIYCEAGHPCRCRVDIYHIH